MSATDRPTTGADNLVGQVVPIDIFAQVTLPVMQEAGIGRRASPQSNGCPGDQWLPPIDVVCASPMQTPGPEGQTSRQPAAAGEAGSEQTRASDQTNIPVNEPAQRSPLADEMHRRRLAAEARHNGQLEQPAPPAPPVRPGQPAQVVRPGQPAVERPRAPSDQPQLPQPTDNGRYKFDEKDYAEAVKKAEREHKRLILDFGADWCGACRTMEANAWPYVNDAIKDRGIFVKINVDRARDLMVQFGVHSLPTTIIVEPGQNGAAPRELHRYVGSMSAGVLRQHLNEDLR